MCTLLMFMFLRDNKKLIWHYFYIISLFFASHPRRRFLVASIAIISISSISLSLMHGKQAAPTCFIINSTSTRHTTYSVWKKKQTTAAAPVATRPSSSMRPIIDRCGVHVDGDSFLPKREVDSSRRCHRHVIVVLEPRVITADTTSNPMGT